MKSKLHYIIMCLPLILTGCGLYNDYYPGRMQYDAGRVIADNDTVVTPLVSMSWRELFTDSCLDNWIETALTANTDLRIAQLKVEEASATLLASRLAFLPSASIGIDGSANSSSAERLQIMPTASWEVDIFGKQRNLKKGAEASLNASVAYSQAVKTSLIASVAEAYYTLLMLDSQLDISERTLKTWDENIRALQALKRAGRTNEAAVLQARANRLKVESSVVSLRKQIEDGENAVRSLLFNPEADVTRDKSDMKLFQDSLLGGVPLVLLSNRPDVREAEYRLQKSFYDINVSRAAFYPSLKLTGSAGWTTTLGGHVSNPSSWVASALGSVVAPLFSRGTNYANLKIAKAEYEIAFLTYQQKLLDAGMEVNEALTSWQAARERIALDKKQIVALRGAVHNTRLLMRNTSTNYLEVLTAQQRLLEAELTEVADSYEAMKAVISLYHALGGGE